MPDNNPGLSDIKVQIIRSFRRHKTVSARLNADTMYVYAPYRITEEKLQKFVDLFRAKFIRQKLKKELNKEHDLLVIAAGLNRKYFGGKLKINSIEYVTNQSSKFGCCDYRRGVIRISHQVAGFPEWVRDYVLVHELAHLVVPNHSQAFWDIVNRYQLAERAKGFLIAKGLDKENVDP